MTLSQQKQLQKHIITKTKKLFALYHPPAHGFDHSERVRKWAVVIAQAEKADVWLNEIIAIIHDIGRTEEKKHPTMTHHELSYQLCQVWFREDRAFDVLTKHQKLVILYALRNHWNSFADKYPEAIILRDADKIDALGKIGIRRTREYFGNTTDRVLLEDFRKRYEMMFHLRTKKARALGKKLKLLEPINAVYIQLLKKEAKEVEL